LTFSWAASAGSPGSGPETVDLKILGSSVPCQNIILNLFLMAKVLRDLFLKHQKLNCGSLAKKIAGSRKSGKLLEGTVSRDYPSPFLKHA
jgi:hypothetical protein